MSFQSRNCDGHPPSYSARTNNHEAPLGAGDTIVYVLPPGQGPSIPTLSNVLSTLTGEQHTYGTQRTTGTSAEDVTENLNRSERENPGWYSAATEETRNVAQPLTTTQSYEDAKLLQQMRASLNRHRAPRPHSVRDTEGRDKESLHSQGTDGNSQATEESGIVPWHSGNTNPDEGLNDLQQMIQESRDRARINRARFAQHEQPLQGKSGDHDGMANMSAERRTKLEEKAVGASAKALRQMQADEAEGEGGRGRQILNKVKRRWPS